MNSNKQIEEYNIVRVIAVILVLLSHCTYYKIITKYGGIDYSPTSSLNITYTDEGTIKALNFFKKILYTFHMPLFFTLSGALFKNSLNKGKIKGFSDLINEKSKRLLIPFFIVGLFYATPIKYLSGYFNDSKNIFIDIFIGQILLQGNSYLWFLPTLFFEFLLIWLIKDKNNNKKEKLTFTLIFSIINIFSNLIKITLIKDVLFYLVYFYIGYCFEDYRKKINRKIDRKNFINNFMVINSIIIMLIAFNYCNFSSKILLKILKYPLKLFMGLIGSYMIYIISYKLSKTKLCNNYFIKMINKYSFGIYLYSDPLNYLILFIIYNIFGIDVFYTNPGIILIFFARVLITFIVALAITSLLKKKKIKYIC